MTTPTTPTSERTLILVRHATAEHVRDKRDHDRELTQRGHADARAVGEWLSHPSRALMPDLIPCSTSKRTRQSLDGVIAGGVSAKEVRFDKRIYDASTAGLLDVLREVPDSAYTVVMIGHAPAIPVLAAALAQVDPESTDILDRLSERFPTAGVAVLGYEGPWAALAPETAYLRDFVVPRG
jgi:phosphohistidine phosphatase